MHPAPIAMRVLAILCAGLSAAAGFADIKVRSPCAEAVAPGGIMPLRHNPPRTQEAIKADIEELVRLGYGGAACNCPFDGYVARESNWAPFVAYVKALKAHGLRAWLYDERGYPSGYAGGLTLKGHPELQAKGYLVSTNGESFRIAPLFEGTHAEVKLSKDRQPYPNILMREATERFLAVNHRRYAEHFGEKLGDYFVSTFTDEPSLMSHWLKPMGEYVLPYSPELPALYGRRTGRRLEDDIKTLVLPDGSPHSLKVRYDFWNLVGELLARNFFGAIDDWCKAHGMLSGGHLMAEEPFADHVGFHGDFLACLKRMSAPGIDMLTIRPRKIARTTPLFVGSARALGGSREAMVEISDHSERMAKPEPLPWTIAEANGAVNLYIWGGVTAFPSYLAVKRMKFSDDTVRAFNRRTGRLVELFSRPGESAAEVALVYPAADLKANYRPGLYRGGSSEIDACQRVFRQVEDSLYRRRRPCLVVDEDFLVNAEVGEGRLSRGALAFRTVILPCVSTLPLAAWRKLAALKEAGGVVVAVGRWPANDTASFPSVEVADLADRLFTRPGQGEPCGISRASAGYGAGVYMPESCARLAGWLVDAFFAPVVEASASSPLRVQHRRMPGGDRFFIFNDSPAPVRDSFCICGGSEGFRLWMPESGDHFPVALPKDRRMTVPLEPYGGVVLEMFKSCHPERLPMRLSMPALPRLRPVQLSRKPYETSRNLALSSQADDSAFHAVGTLDAASSDTFHWVNYDYSAPPMAASGAMLLLDVAVEGEARDGKGPAVMVFLKAADGKSHLANSSVTLGKSGRTLIVLDAEDFRPFRHSDALDMAAITGIAIGYGGWRKGQSGDRIAFAVRPPQFIEL